MKVILLITLLCLSALRCQAHSVPVDSTKTKNEVDTTTHVYIVDDKQVTYKYIIDHYDDLEWVTCYNTVREALLLSGGEYKSPTMIWRTRREDEQ